MTKRLSDRFDTARLSAQAISLAHFSEIHRLHTEEVLPDEDEKKLVGALIAISAGVEDAAGLGVPVEVGRRLLECCDELGED